VKLVWLHTKVTKVVFIDISGLSDTQRELVDLAQKFTKDEIIPKAAEYDKTMDYPWDIIKKAWSVGLLNPLIPEKFGKRFCIL